MWTCEIGRASAKQGAVVPEAEAVSMSGVTLYPRYTAAYDTRGVV